MSFFKIEFKILLIFNFFPKKDNSYFKKAQIDFITEPPPQNELDIFKFDVGAMVLNVFNPFQANEFFRIEFFLPEKITPITIGYFRPFCPQRN